MGTIKIIATYLFLFVLFYFESVQIGPITISQMWKIPFFGFLVISVFSIQNRTSPNFLKWSYLRGYKNLLNGGLFGNIFPEIISFIRYMMFPLMVNFFKVTIKSVEKIEVITVNFARFFILAGIPFLIGILEPLGRELTIGIDNLEEYIGIFQAPHAASTTTAISLLVLLFKLKDKRDKLFKRVFDYFLIALGLVLLYKTYVRTGYLMFTIGVLILFLPRHLSFKQIVKWVFAILIISVGFLYLLNTNQAFYNRIFDIRPGQEIIRPGSGRLDLWVASYQIWLDSNILEKFFGVGLSNLFDSMGLIAHSELFNQLVQNGIFGLIILFGYLISIYRYIKSRANIPSYRLSLTMFFMYISYLMVQGGMNFFIELFFALIIVRLMLEEENLNQIR